jgi:hypothetical protein
MQDDDDLQREVAKVRDRYRSLMLADLEELRRAKTKAEPGDGLKPLRPRLENGLWLYC